MYSRKQILDILEMAVLAGRILLENGAETYRVEETINRLCYACGLESVDNFTIPTGIFVSVSHGDHLITKVVTVRTRDIDLEIIALINGFSRSFVATPMGIEEGVKKLKEIEQTEHYPGWMQVVAGSFGGSFFALLFGCNGVEFVLAFITTAAVMLGYQGLNRAKFSTFIVHVLCGCINMLTALVLTRIVWVIGAQPRLEMLVIGALMPLVPGVAITNAVRDVISGDYVSGMSRLLEALMVAVGLALGVGIVLNLNYLIGR